MNFYLAVVDDKLRHESDAPSIGLVLCQDRNQIVAEYALRGVSTPIGISEYELTRASYRRVSSRHCRQSRKSKPNSAICLRKNPRKIPGVRPRKKSKGHAQRSGSAKKSTKN